MGPDGAITKEPQVKDAIQHWLLGSHNKEILMLKHQGTALAKVNWITVLVTKEHCLSVRMLLNYEHDSVRA